MHSSVVRISKHTQIELDIFENADCTQLKFNKYRNIFFDVVCCWLVGYVGVQFQVLSLYFAKIYLKMYERR